MVSKHQLYLVFFITIVLHLLGNASLLAQSNEGTNFWFGFMEHRDVNTNAKVAMITSKYNTSGIVSVPNENWSENFTVLANDVVIVPLPSYTENIGSEMVDDVGIHLTSNDPVSVYIHQYHNARSEATVVLPVSSLGEEYYVMTYKGVNHNGQVYPSEFLIVGTQDETNLTITLSDLTVGGQAAGTTFNITLDAGDTYQVQASKGSGDMTGSHITGDKNFAVFSGNSWTEVPTNCDARDNLLEQMYPVSTWGKKFITVPNAVVNYDVFRILASEDNTTVNIFGASLNTTETLNSGEFTEYNKSEATFISADKPIQVAQFNVGTNCSGHHLGDPSMVLLNSFEQTRDTVTLYNSSFQNITENYINIIVATDDIPFVTFDQQAIPASAETGTVGLNNEFTYIRLSVNKGAHTIISDACGVIATAYGYGDVESYAYSGGASFKSININPIPEGGCLNDTILFNAQLPEARYSFFWDLGDGNTSTLAKFEYFYPDLGSYPVELIITDECLGTQDTVNRDLLISLRQAVNASGDSTLCEGGSFELSATDLPGAIFEWTGPSNYFSNNQFPVINNATHNMSGGYAVIGIISGCATFPTFSNVDIIQTPTPDLGPDTIFCNLNVETTINPGNYTDYRWQDNSNRPFFQVQEDGHYWVAVTDQNGCMGSDSVWLRQICPTEVYIPNAFSPNFDGINDYFQVFGHDIINMRLRIYDRWGSFLFESNSQEVGWDGTYKGEAVQTGIYVWQLEIEGYYSDGSIYKEVLSGEITLLR